MPSSSFNLSDLDGSNGFVIHSINPGERFGFSVSNAGDINGDGFDDLIIGAPGPDFSPLDPPGSSYIVFGGTTVGIDGSFDLSSLDGSNGFVINGINPGDQFGYSVSSAGDINGDGIDDLIIGAPGEAFGATSPSTYVVFGGSNVGSGGSFDLSSLDGSNGFALDGGGYSVSSAGDINGDGFDDLIVEEPFVYSSGGTSYVVFGGPEVATGGSFSLSSLNGSNGFVINTYSLDGDGRTNSVSSAGDINGDGFDDLIIGSPTDAGFYPQGGASISYVVFGGPTVGGDGNFDISSLDGSNGFVINGLEADDNLGWSVSRAGDINGDGIDDLIIGAPGWSEFDPQNDSSKSYVVFGGRDIGAGGSFDLSSLDGSNGFVINGINPKDSSGWSVSAAGDINGDGIADLIIGAPNADPNGNNSGSTYIVFGSADVGAGGSFDLSSLDGSNGFVLNGIAAKDLSGISVSGAGDVNGDGIDDVIIGAPGSGSSYVVFGSAVSQPNPTAGNDTLIGTSAGDLIGGGAGDALLNGGTESDRFLLAPTRGNDTITNFESGTDSLVLLQGLTFGQLDITQSHDDTLLSVASTGQVLATLTGVQANLLTAADFTTI